MKKNKTALQLWGMPLLIGIISIIGLTTALVYDNWGDVFSWILLGIPVIIIFYFGKKILK